MKLYILKSKKALKTQVLKEKTQIIKRKGLSPKKDVLPAKIPKKEKVHIHRRLGERIQLQTTNDDNGPRRVIKSKRCLYWLKYCG